MIDLLTCTIVMVPNQLSHLFIPRILIGSDRPARLAIHRVGFGWRLRSQRREWPEPGKNGSAGVSVGEEQASGGGERGALVAVRRPSSCDIWLFYYYLK